MKRYIVSRQHDEFKICPINLVIDGAPGIQIVKIVNEDRVTADLTDDAVHWIQKFFPTFSVDEYIQLHPLQGHK